MNVEVRNNPTEYRYEVWADGELAGYAQYVLRRGRIAFVHTKVYESYDGLGLGVPTFSGPACLATFEVTNALGDGDKISNRVVDGLGDQRGAAWVTTGPRPLVRLLR